MRALKEQFDIHIGLREDEVKHFVDTFHPGRNPDGTRPQVFHTTADLGGLSWEQWGEQPWPEEEHRLFYPGPEEGRHVVIRVDTWAQVVRIIDALEEATYDLVRMRFHHQWGTYLVVTNAEDWSTVNHALTDRR